MLNQQPSLINLGKNNTQNEHMKENIPIIWYDKVEKKQSNLIRHKAYYA